MTLTNSAVSVLALIKDRHAYATRPVSLPADAALCLECGHRWPCPTYRTTLLIEHKHEAAHCADRDCPDFGSADFGEGTCPAEHSSWMRP